MLGPADMDYILDHAEVKFALIDDNLLRRSRTAAPRCEKRGIDADRVDLTGKAAALGLQSFNDLIEGQSEIEPEIEFDERDLAMIIYTSGTTSRPKGAMHCHLAVVMAVMSNAIEMQLGRNDGITGQFPLFHCAGHVLLLSYLVGRRPHGDDARLRSGGLHGGDPARQAHRLRRAVADVSGDPRSSAAQGIRPLGPALPASTPWRRWARPLLERAIAEHVPEFRADLRPDRNVSGDHDVAAGPPAEALRQLLGRID